MGCGYYWVIADTLERQDEYCYERLEDARRKFDLLYAEGGWLMLDLGGFDDAGNEIIVRSVTRAAHA